MAAAAAEEALKRKRDGILRGYEALDAAERIVDSILNGGAKIMYDEYVNAKL